MVYCLIGAFVLACSSNGNGIDPDDDTISSIVISADSNLLETGETVNFTVIANTGKDVTSSSAITVNGNVITGSSYTPSESGSYSVKATYESIQSNFLIVDVTDPITLVSVQVTATPTAVFVGDVVTFTATAVYSNNNTLDVTEDSEFSVDGNAITGTEYTTTAVGTIQVIASYEGVESDLAEIQVIDRSSLPADFTKKAVIEDYTGTWCGWCPRVSYAISLVEDQTDKVFAIGIHNGDVMANSFGGQMEAAFNISGFPTAYIDRSSTWTFPEPSNFAQAVSAATGTTDLGLAISNTISGTTMDINVKTAFVANKDNIKLVVFVLEDNIIANQINYTDYYGGASTITGFEHHGVLRYSATAVLGDAITSTIGIHEYDYTVNLASYNVSDVNKTSVVAMLVDQTGKVVLNAQKVLVGLTQAFD